MRRELVPSYLMVVGGLLAGLLIGGVITDPEPAVLGWLLGGGMGLTAGAFVAAILAGVPLAGSRSGVSAPRAGGGGADPLDYLRGASGADEAAIEPAVEDSPGEGSTAGLTSLGRGGNGRAL